jgi:hypothetical protein
MSKQDQKRIVKSPPDVSSARSGEILSVEVAEDEDVVWHWTHQPDGISFISGYEIVKIERKERPVDGSTRNDRDQRFGRDDRSR